MSQPEQKPNSTASDRREWALNYARGRASTGDFATVRQVQSATREHFGRGLGNQTAAEIVREVTRSSRMGGPQLLEQPREATVPFIGGAQGLMLIAKLMRDSGIRSIELCEDGALRLTPG